MAKNRPVRNYYRCGPACFATDVFSAEFFSAEFFSAEFFYTAVSIIFTADGPLFMANRIVYSGF
jgi:hypothetical protein